MHHCGLNIPKWDKNTNFLLQLHFPSDSAGRFTVCKMKYLDYILRHPLPNETDASILSSRPHVVMWSVISAGVFVSLCLGLPIAINFLAPSFIKGLSSKKKKELPTYAACLAHHLVVVPWSCYKIYEALTADNDHDLMRGEDLSFIIALSFGYLVGDSAFLGIQDLLEGRPEFMIHHTLAFLLIYLTVQSPEFVTRFIPHIEVCELSSVFFSFAWFTRASGAERHNSSFLSALEVAFALSFLLTRVINLLFTVTAVLMLCDSLVFKIVVIAIYTLQLYWLRKIVQSMTGGGKSKRG